MGSAGHVWVFVTENRLGGLQSYFSAEFWLYVCEDVVMASEGPAPVLFTQVLDAHGSVGFPLYVCEGFLMASEGPAPVLLTENCVPVLPAYCSVEFSLCVSGGATAVS
jgi:hypothetical protein